VLNRTDLLHRAVLVLRHFEQLNNAEITGTLGMNESTASSRCLEALMCLKHEVQIIPRLFGS
jgi:DNA-directed RNA polymerase specialized sigma24 family protein